MSAHRRLGIGRSAVVEQKSNDGVVSLLCGLMKRGVAGSRGRTDLQSTTLNRRARTGQRRTGAPYWSRKRTMLICPKWEAT